MSTWKIPTQKIPTRIIAIQKIPSNLVPTQTILRPNNKTIPARYFLFADKVKVAWSTQT